MWTDIPVSPRLQANVFPHLLIIPTFSIIMDNVLKFVQFFSHNHTTTHSELR